MVVVFATVGALDFLLMEKVKGFDWSGLQVWHNQLEICFIVVIGG